MSWNKSPLAFDDVRQAFEDALTSETGIRIRYATRGRAVTERSRFNYFRKVERADSKNVYEPDHPLHGRCMYDKFTLRIPPKGAEDETYLYIEPRKYEDLEIEVIPPKK